MKTRLRARFWIEISLSTLSGLLFVLTLIQRDWIEIVIGIEPDEGSGALEWLIVIGLMAATIIFALLARSEWYRRQEPAA